jgi:hypothetical protein
MKSKLRIRLFHFQTSGYLQGLPCWVPKPKKQRNKYIHPRVVHQQDVIGGTLDFQHGRLAVDEYLSRSRL